MSMPTEDSEQTIDLNGIITSIPIPDIFIIARVNAKILIS